MSLNLQIISLLFVLLIIFIIIYILRKGRIYIKYSLVWLFSSGLLLFSILIPGFLDFVTRLLGFRVASNMIFAFIIAMLMFITISLTIIVSGQNEKIRLLIQEFSMLKSKIEKGDKK